MTNDQSPNLHATPLQIPFSTGSLFGVLRNTVSVSKELVILCPAATGTRIGPQRIFVEIAQALLKNEVASFCVDFPPLGDSFDNKIQNKGGQFSQRLSMHYTKYLNLLLKYFEEKYSFKHFYLLSISDGCVPIYNFAKCNPIICGLVLLSPNHKLDISDSINKNNIRRYLFKLFIRETWIKLFTLNLNFNRIVKNIYHKPTKIKQQTKDARTKASPISNLLTLFGEKEHDLKGCIDFWEAEKKSGAINVYENRIIAGADHSFFGWQFKRDVVDHILFWFNKEKVTKVASEE